jgi:hypothetical protein
MALSSSADGLILLLLLHHCRDIELNDKMGLMQKIYLLSMKIEIPQTNALKSVGNTDTVLFLSIGNPDKKNVDKSTTVYIRVTNY